MIAYHHWNQEGRSKHTALQMLWKWWVWLRYKVWKLTWFREFCRWFVSRILSVFSFILRKFCTSNIFAGHAQQTPTRSGASSLLPSRRCESPNAPLPCTNCKEEARRRGQACESAWRADCWCNARWLQFYYISTDGEFTVNNIGCDFVIKLLSKKRSRSRDGALQNK